MAGDALDDGLVVVEFAVDVPTLNPAAARALLDLLLTARDRQAAENQQAGNGGAAGCPADNEHQSPSGR
jgi:hypothetical protein